MEEAVSIYNLKDFAALDTLEREEQSVSEKRRAVQVVMDACTAEITRRYREGDADVSDLLPTEA